MTMKNDLLTLGVLLILALGILPFISLAQGEEEPCGFWCNVRLFFGADALVGKSAAQEIEQEVIANPGEDLVQVVAGQLHIRDRESEIAFDNPHAGLSEGNLPPTIRYRSLPASPWGTLTLRRDAAGRLGYYTAAGERQQIIGGRLRYISYVPPAQAAVESDDPLAGTPGVVQHYPPPVVAPGGAAAVSPRTAQPERGEPAPITVGGTTYTPSSVRASVSDNERYVIYTAPDDEQFIFYEDTWRQVAFVERLPRGVYTHFGSVSLTSGSERYIVFTDSRGRAVTDATRADTSRLLTAEHAQSAVTRISPGSPEAAAGAAQEVGQPGQQIAADADSLRRGRDIAYRVAFPEETFTCQQSSSTAIICSSGQSFVQPLSNGYEVERRDGNNNVVYRVFVEDDGTARIIGNNVQGLQSLEGDYSDGNNHNYVDELHQLGFLTDEQYDDIRGGGTIPIFSRLFNWEEDMEFVHETVERNIAEHQRQLSTEQSREGGAGASDMPTPGPAPAAGAPAAAGATAREQPSSEWTRDTQRTVNVGGNTYSIYQKGEQLILVDPVSGALYNSNGNMIGYRERNQFRFTEDIPERVRQGAYQQGATLTFEGLPEGAGRAEPSAPGTPAGATPAGGAPPGGAEPPTPAADQPAERSWTYSSDNIQRLRGGFARILESEGTTTLHTRTVSDFLVRLHDGGINTDFNGDSKLDDADDEMFQNLNSDIIVNGRIRSGTEISRINIPTLSPTLSPTPGAQQEDEAPAGGTPPPQGGAPSGPSPPAREEQFTTIRSFTIDGVTYFTDQYGHIYDEDGVLLTVQALGELDPRDNPEYAQAVEQARQAAQQQRAEEEGGERAAARRPPEIPFEQQVLQRVQRGEITNTDAYELLNGHSLRLEADARQVRDQLGQPRTAAELNAYGTGTRADLNGREIVRQEGGWYLDGRLIPDADLTKAAVAGLITNAGSTEERQAAVDVEAAAKDAREKAEARRWAGSWFEIAGTEWYHNLFRGETSVQQFTSGVFIGLSQMGSYQPLSTLLFGAETSRNWLFDEEGAFFRTLSQWGDLPSYVATGRITGLDVLAHCSYDDLRRADLPGSSSQFIETPSGTKQFVGSIQAERSPSRAPVLCHRDPAPDAEEQFICDNDLFCLDDEYCYTDEDATEPEQGYFYKIAWGVASPADEAQTPYIDEDRKSIKFNVQLNPGGIWLYQREMLIGDTVIALENGESDRDVILHYSPELYTEACIRYNSRYRALDRDGNPAEDQCVSIEPTERGEVEFTQSQRTPSVTTSSGQVSQNRNW